MKIIHLLDRHRTWLEIESIATVRNHTIVRNGRMTDILSRVLVVKAIHHHFPYTRGQVWQIAEYDLEQAIKSLRTNRRSFPSENNQGRTDTGGVWSVSYPLPHTVSSSPT